MHLHFGVLMYIQHLQLVNIHTRRYLVYNKTKFSFRTVLTYVSRSIRLKV